MAWHTLRDGRLISEYTPSVQNWALHLKETNPTKGRSAIKTLEIDSVSFEDYLSTYLLVQTFSVQSKVSCQIPYSLLCPHFSHASTP
jgi:hypothetical protein